MSDQDRHQAEVMDELRQQEEAATPPKSLLHVNVNQHTEKKGQLTYLSWAWAWAEVLKHDPVATWVVHTYGPQGSEQPCMWIGDTAMVHTSVTVHGLRRECMLPVMDHKNNAMKNPDARKISDAIMRCMTKAISMHGLGLYIYAGEDLPESNGAEPPAPKTKPGPVVAESFRSSATMGEWERLPKDWQDYLLDLAAQITAMVGDGQAMAAHLKLLGEKLEDDQATALWSRLDSKVRSALTRASNEVKAAAKAGA